MDESILSSIKKLLGIDAAYTEFDVDILAHINAALATLNQVGIGPSMGFFVSDSKQTWTEFLGVDPRLNQAKQYVYDSVRLAFDPPATSFHIQALEKRMQENLWRLEVARALPIPIPTLMPTIDGGDPDDRP